MISQDVHPWDVDDQRWRKQYRCHRCCCCLGNRGGGHVGCRSTIIEGDKETCCKRRSVDLACLGDIVDTRNHQKDQKKLRLKELFQGKLVGGGVALFEGWCRIVWGMVSLIFNLEKDDLDFVKIWVFPKIGVPQNGWFRMENPITMDDLRGKPLFLETSIYFQFSLISFASSLHRPLSKEWSRDLFAKKGKPCTALSSPMLSKRMPMLIWSSWMMSVAWNWHRNQQLFFMSPRFVLPSLKLT